MSKCRYDLSEDCHNKDCLNCVLDNIRAEIEDAAFDSQEIDGEHESVMLVDLDDALNIIDKYKSLRRRNDQI